jgi:hypothetical protein
MSLPSLRQPNTTSKSTQPIFQRGKTTSFAYADKVDDIDEISLTSNNKTNKKSNKNGILPAAIKGAFTADFQQNKKDTQELSDLAKKFDQASLNATIAQARQEVADRASQRADTIMNRNTNEFPIIKKQRTNSGGKRKTRKNRRTRKSKKSKRRSTRRHIK